MLHAWQGRIYKRKVFSFLWPRQPPRKHLKWGLWRHTLKPMIRNTTNRSLKFPLGRWEKKPSTIGNGFTPVRPTSYMPNMAKFIQTMLWLTEVPDVMTATSLSQQDFVKLFQVILMRPMFISTGHTNYWVELLHYVNQQYIVDLRSSVVYKKRYNCHLSTTIGQLKKCGRRIRDS